MSTKRRITLSLSPSQVRLLSLALDEALLEQDDLLDGTEFDSADVQNLYSVIQNAERKAREGEGSEADE